MEYKSIIVALMVVGFAITSCKKEEVGPQQETQNDPVILNGASKLLVGCEGTFGWLNASVSAYNFTTEWMVNAQYQAANGSSLGDVLQSMFKHDDKIYFVVNNSSVIRVTDASTLNWESNIELEQRSPRYMVAKEDKAFVSNFVWNPPPETPVYIDVLDLSTNIVVDSIDVGCWTEEMMIVDDRLYVCGTGENKVFEIDLESHTVVQELIVGKEPVAIEQVGDRLYVLCTGGIGSNNTEPASLCSFIPDGSNAVDVVSFPASDMKPSRLEAYENDLYWLNEGVYKMNVSATVFPEDPIVSTEDITAYALEVNNTNGDIYVTDAKDYQSNGSLLMYDSQGNFKLERETGVIPSSFLFN